MSSLSISSATLKDPHLWPARALRWSVQTWFVLAVLGQWLFVAYVAAFYGSSAIGGDLEAWNQVLPNGYINGDTIGNAALAGHLALAIIIMVGGPLQLTPQVRNRFPTFHRWNGRSYLLALVLTSTLGLYLVWSRDNPNFSELAQHIGISLNALLILIFAYFALQTALARNFVVHRRWAIRLFLAACGVWFFRVGLMFWLAINGGPVGIDFETFTGPFLIFLSFANYLIPLAVFEIYWRVKEHGSAAAQSILAAAFVMFIGMMLMGITVAAMGMWLPRIQGLF